MPYISKRSFICTLIYTYHSLSAEKKNPPRLKFTNALKCITSISLFCKRLEKSSFIKEQNMQDKKLLSCEIVFPTINCNLDFIILRYIVTNNYFFKTCKLYYGFLRYIY